MKQSVMEAIIADTDCAYYPAIVCAEYDSPIDALIGLCVPHDEAMNLVVAFWRSAGNSSLLATLDGGRTVAALRTPAGRWAACNAFVDKACRTPEAARHELDKLLKRGRSGYVGVLVRDPAP